MEKHTFSDDDRLYLQMMQDNITRMAINMYQLQVVDGDVDVGLFGIGM